MNRPSPFVPLATSLSVLTLLLALAAASPSFAQWPPEVKSLEVLPQDTPFRELMGTMRGFTSALGVRCQHCHVGEEGMPLDQFDFASDERPAKERARAMLRMTAAINSDHLAKLGVEGGALEVECVTCHRGTTRPERLADVLVRTASEDGIEAALAGYRELRADYHGSGTYDFSEVSLIASAEELLGKGGAEAAVRLLELNLEHHPESDWTRQTLAVAYEQAGRTGDALAVWRKILEENPGNSRVEQQIKRLSSLEEEDAP
ncbi:MAG: c-type cytochrome [Acidobacteriota bacterium]